MHDYPFGGLTAEAEAADPERYATELYFPHVSDGRHEQARSASCKFIIGRRGSGKTSLAYYLQTQKDEPYRAFVLIHSHGNTFGRIHKEVSDSIASKGMPFGEDVARLWSLAIWTAIMSELDKRGFVHSAAVKTYLGAARGPIFKGTQIFIDGLVSLVSKSGSGMLDWDRLSSVLEEASYSRALEDTRSALDRLDRVAVVIDTPEECLRTSAETASLMGLLMAVNRPQSEYHRNLHLKCLVVSEVWAHVSSRMPGIDRYDPLMLRWSVVDLMSLMCYRYNNFVAEHQFSEAVPPGVIHWKSPAEVRHRVWDHYFPTSAPGPSGFMETTVELVLRHTQLRPRQAIAIGNAITRESRGWRFRNSQVTKAVVDRAEWLCSEIFASYVDIYPNAEMLALENFRGRPAVFSAEGMNLSAAIWDTAYQLGIAGPVIRKSKRREPEPDFTEYQDAEFEFCNSAARLWRPSSGLVAIHPIFHKRLDIRESGETVVGLPSQYAGASPSYWR